MKSLSRRDWFKSTLTLSTGFGLSTVFADQLLAAPVSRAEELHVSKVTGKELNL